MSEALSAQSKPRVSSPSAAVWRPEYVRLWRQLLVASVLILSLCLWCSPVAPYNRQGVVILMALAVVVSLTPIALPGNGIIFSPVLPIFFAAAGLFGATAAVLVAVSSTTMIGLIRMVGMLAARRGAPRVRWLMQAAAVPVVTNGPSALLYVFLHTVLFPKHGLSAGEKPHLIALITISFCALIAFAASYLLNTFLSSRYYGRRWEVIWHDNARWNMISGVLMSPLAFVMAVLYNEHWWLGVIFIACPTFAARAVVAYHERTIGAYKQGVELLGRIMQESHPYTHGHLNRVAHWAKRIAEELALPPESMQFIEDAAILHDIGKVAVDDRVLNKVGKLSDDDWAMIRRHPVTGAEIVGHIDYFSKVSHWIRHHHERPDGGGYPDKMASSDIPIESAIISVVDAYDAMVGGPAKEDKRPYRDPMEPEAAVAELRRHAGTQFHPDVVEAFVTILEREKAIEATGQHPIPSAGAEGDSLWDAPLNTAASLGVFVTAAGRRS